MSERSVLLALREHESVSAAVQRTVEAARELRASIHVLHVLPRGKRGTSVASTRLLVSSLRAVEETLAATSRGNPTTIPATEMVSSVAVLHGDFEESVAAYAEAVGSTCIVLVSPGAVRQTAHRPE